MCKENRLIELRLYSGSPEHPLLQGYAEHQTEEQTEMLQNSVSFLLLSYCMKILSEPYIVQIHTELSLFLLNVVIFWHHLFTVNFNEAWKVLITSAVK